MGFFIRNGLYKPIYYTALTRPPAPVSDPKVTQASGTGEELTLTSMDVESNNDTKITTATSGRTQRVAVGGQYWSFKINSTFMEEDDFRAQYTKFITLDGQVKPFLFNPKFISSGTPSGTLTVSDDYVAGSLECRSTGGSGSLKKGDFIKFSNHDKVYMLTEDVNLNQVDSSEDVIKFYPNLVTAISNTTTIIYTDVNFVCYLDQNRVGFSISTDGLYKYQLNFNEEI